MKSFISAAACGLILLCSGLLQADLPELVDCGLLQDGGADLLVSQGAIPASADWNNDGRKDLIVGQYLDGWIWLFLNQGTDLNPVFNGGTLIESNGVPITYPYS